MNKKKGQPPYGPWSMPHGGAWQSDYWIDEICDDEEEIRKEFEERLKESQENN